MTPLLTGVFASQISGRLTPSWQPTSAYDALSTVIVPSGGLSSITFAGIPAIGYNHLQLRVMLKTTTNSNSDGGVFYRFNDDSSSNYSNHDIRAAGGGSVSVYGAGNSTACGMGFATGTNGNNTNLFTAYVIDILDYANLNIYKTTRSLEGYIVPGQEGSFWIRSNNWRSFDAINKITFAGSTFAENSQLSLYGVK